MNILEPFPLRQLGSTPQTQTSINKGTFLLRDENTQGSDILCYASKSEWDSGHIGKEVFRISIMQQVSNTVSESFPDFHCWISENSIDLSHLVWVRVPSEELSAVQTLEKYGFIYVSGLASFVRNIKAVVNEDIQTVRAAIGGEEKIIAEIARNSFLKDRLYFEPGVGEGTASRMYAEWAENCCGILCDEVLVETSNGVIRGFVSLKEDSKFSNSLGGKTMRIVLIAVRDTQRGKGVGKHLIQAVDQYCRNAGAEWCLVGTSTSNIPAQRLYVRSGYLPHYSEVCMSYYGI